MKHLDMEQKWRIAAIIICVVMALTGVSVIGIDYKLSNVRQEISVMEQKISDLAKDIRDAGGSVELPSSYVTTVVTQSVVDVVDIDYNARVEKDTRALFNFMQKLIDSCQVDYIKARNDFSKLLISDRQSLAVDLKGAQSVVGAFFPRKDFTEQQYVPNGFEMKRIYIEDIQILPIGNFGDTIEYAAFFKYSGLNRNTDVLVANNVFMILDISADGELLFKQCCVPYV